MDNKEFIKGIYQKYESEKKSKRDSFYFSHSYRNSSRLVLKTAATFILALTLLVGVFYAGVTATKYFGKVSLRPSYTEGLAKSDMNDIWVGTFQLIWNDAMDYIVGGPIEFENAESALASELNKQSFTEEMLSQDSYYKTWGIISDELREKIEQGILQKFGEKSDILDRLPWESKGNGYILYAMLKKQFHFIVPFIEAGAEPFGNSEEYVRYFGADATTPKETFQNIQVLFHNSNEECGVTLKTKEGEEVILYKTKENTMSFEDAYNKLQNQAQSYTGNKNFTEEDVLRVPYIKLEKDINYDELCYKYIKGTDLYIEKAIQTIQFELNNTGGSVKSEAGMGLLKTAILEEPRYFKYNDSFYLFLKESDKEKPYLALRVNNTDILQTREKPREISENYTVITTIDEAK